MRHAVEEAIDAGAEGRLLACRIELTGRADSMITCWYRPSNFLPRRAPPRLPSATRHHGSSASLSLRRRCSIRRYSPDARMRSANFFACWERPPGSELLGQLETDVGELVRKLPFDIRDDIEDVALKAALQRDYPALIAHVRGYLNARLTAQKD